MACDAGDRSSSPGPEKQDREALAGLIGRSEPTLPARIRRMMGPEARQGAESSDILQSVLTEALRDLQADIARDEKRLLLWMTATARHRIIDEVRRRREQSIEQLGGRLAFAESSVASQLSTQETMHRLGEALDTLAPDRRSVVELRSFDGWPWQRIAKALGRSEEAVRKLYHRALLELGQGLGELGAESGPRLVDCAAQLPG